MIPLYHLLKCSKKKNDVKFYFFSREQTTTPTTISRIFAARRVGMTSGGRYGMTSGRKNMSRKGTRHTDRAA